MKSFSPLRYPGGKAKVYDKVINFFVLNKFSSITYVEPFAGGSGLALLLLKNNKVDIKKLNANKVAQTIIEQKDILLKEENEVSPDRENTELLLDDKSIDNMTINVDKSEEDLWDYS